MIPNPLPATHLPQALYALCQQLFPLHRSLTGDGFRASLSLLEPYLPGLIHHEVASGTRCFDWTVPDEWNIREAFIITPTGDKILDFKTCNLHVMGYSIPVQQALSLEDLQPHLYSLPNQPDAIPYVTSYYKKQWGFCLSHYQRQTLKPGIYQVVIDSDLKPGHLTYGEWILPGHSPQEIFFSTYLCHPSMANNELSGPVVTAFLAQWLAHLPQRRYTYRIIIIPETIGALVYLSRHLPHLKKHVIAGFNVTCVGDDRAYSYLPSRAGNTLADQVAQHVLKHQHPDYIAYRFLDRGSDERQYNSPGIDLPVCSLMRSKYGCYPEYHTSLDNLTLVTPQGLYGSYQVLQKAITCLEHNLIWRTTVYGEPQLSRYGLYPTTSIKDNRSTDTRRMLDFLAYADGTLTALAIAERIEAPLWELIDLIHQLHHAGLLEACDPPLPMP